MVTKTHQTISECALAAAACLDEFVCSLDMLFEHSGAELRELAPTNHFPTHSGDEAASTPARLMDVIRALDPAFRVMGFKGESGRPMGDGYTGLWLKGHTIDVEQKWTRLALKLRQVGLAAADRYQGCGNRERPDSTQFMVIPADTRRWAVAAAGRLREIANELGVQTSSGKPGPTEPAVAPPSDVWMLARWYSVASHGALYPNLLFRSWQNGRILRRQRTGRPREFEYELESVCSAYPEFADELRRSVTELDPRELRRKRRKPTQTNTKQVKRA